MVLPIFTSLVKIRKETLEAAYDLGASRLKAFFAVTLPLSSTGVIMGSLLVFISVLGAFIIPDWIAGTQLHLVGNQVYLEITSPTEFPQGAASAVFLIVATLILILVYAHYAQSMGLEEGRGRTLLGRLWRGLRRRGSRPQRRSPGDVYGIGAPTRRGPPRAETGPPSEVELRQANPDAPNPGAFRRMHGRATRAMDALAERGGRWFLGSVTVLLLLSYYVPLAYVVLFSFNHANNLVVWQGFSTRWWVPDPQFGGVGEVRSLFADREVLAALQHSLVVGLASSGLAVFLGTLAAMGLARYRFRFRAPVNGLLYMGLVVPSIVLGLALLIFITFLNDFFLLPLLGLQWRTGLLSIIVAHTTFNIPLATIVMLISFSEFDRTVEEAAMDLGADEVQTFFRITLPMVKPGLISAALLTFTWSFDDLVVTLFTKGQGIETLPVLIWGLMSKKVLTPEIMAVSTLILAIATVFVLLANRVSRGGMIFRI